PSTCARGSGSTRSHRDRSTRLRSMSSPATTSCARSWRRRHRCDDWASRPTSPPPPCIWRRPPAPFSPPRLSRWTAASSCPTSSFPSPTCKDLAMAIRVAQIGTGNVGQHALSGILANPQFELTALWVSSEAKAGRDAAELAGLHEPSGVIATNDLAKVIDAQPDCAVYTALADNQLPDAVGDYRRLFEA